MTIRKIIAPSFGAPVPQYVAPRVLVIDDDLAGATTTLAGLAGEGYRTVAGSDGDTVLRLVRTESLQLVVTELYVPCADGPCVVTALRRDRARLPPLYVLVHTRHTTPADDAWALAAGCDAVLHKPASAAAVARELRRLEGVDAVEFGPSAGGRS